MPSPNRITTEEKMVEAHTPEKLTENDKTTILWDVSIDTDNDKTAIRSDRAVRDHQEKACFLIDVSSIPTDDSISSKRNGETFKI